MVARDIDFRRTVTQQVVDEESSIVEAIAPFAQQAYDMYADSQVLDGLSQYNLALNQLDMDYRIGSSADPLSQESRLKYETQRKQIQSQFESSVPVTHRFQWGQKAREANYRSDIGNQQWAFEQVRANTVNNLNNSIATHLDMMGQSGRQYAASGGAMNVADALSFQDAKANLYETASKWLGEAEANQILQNFEADSVKMFISGVVHDNPELALKLMDMPEYDGYLNKTTKVDFESVAKRNIFEKEFKTSMQQMVNADSLMEEISKEDIPYYQKEILIDRARGQDNISSEMATQAKALLKAVNPQAETDNETFFDLLVRARGLPASYKKSKYEEYLNSAAALEADISTAMADGKLSQKDAQKILKEKSYINKIVNATEELSKSGFFSWWYEDAFEVFENGLGDRSLALAALKDYYYKYPTETFDAMSKKERKMKAQEVLDSYKQRVISETAPAANPAASGFRLLGVIEE